LRPALGSLVALTLQKLELKARQFKEIKEVPEDQRPALETALLSFVGERVSLRHALNRCADSVELHPLTVEVGGRNRVTNNTYAADTPTIGAVDDKSMCSRF
jgi:hypothetical protein